jgi:hypothetical protein
MSSGLAAVEELRADSVTGPSGVPPSARALPPGVLGDSMYGADPGAEALEEPLGLEVLRAESVHASAAPLIHSGTPSRSLAPTPPLALKTPRVSDSNMRGSDATCDSNMRLRGSAWDAAAGEESGGVSTPVRGNAREKAVRLALEPSASGELSKSPRPSGLLAAPRSAGPRSAAVAPLDAYRASASGLLTAGPAPAAPSVRTLPPTAPSVPSLSVNGQIGSQTLSKSPWSSTLAEVKAVTPSAKSTRMFGTAETALVDLTVPARIIPPARECLGRGRLCLHGS